jgi:hypothetical protein
MLDTLGRERIVYLQTAAIIHVYLKQAVGSILV